jgi:hypothetical protein
VPIDMPAAFASADPLGFVTTGTSPPFVIGVKLYPASTRVDRRKTMTGEQSPVAQIQDHQGAHPQTEVALNSRRI